MRLPGPDEGRPSSTLISAQSKGTRTTSNAERHQGRDVTQQFKEKKTDVAEIVFLDGNRGFRVNTDTSSDVCD